MTTIVCSSGKRRYRRRRDAIRALKRVQSHATCTCRRVYRCPSCDGFHLTSQR